MHITPTIHLISIRGILITKYFSISGTIPIKIGRVIIFTMLVVLSAALIHGHMIRCPLVAIAPTIAASAPVKIGGIYAFTI